MIDISEYKKSLFCDNNRDHNNANKCYKHQTNYHLHLTISAPHLSLNFSSTRFKHHRIFFLNYKNTFKVWCFLLKTIKVHCIVHQFDCVLCEIIFYLCSIEDTSLRRRLAYPILSIFLRSLNFYTIYVIFCLEWRRRTDWKRNRVHQPNFNNLRAELGAESFD